MHCIVWHDPALELSDQKTLDDLQGLPQYEHGEFEIDTRKPDQVLLNSDDPFMEQVKTIASGPCHPTLRGDKWAYKCTKVRLYT